MYNTEEIFRRPYPSVRLKVDVSEIEKISFILFKESVKFTETRYSNGFNIIKRLHSIQALK